MAWAHAAIYSGYVLGLLKGQSRLLQKMNDGFDIPGDAEAGVITVLMYGDQTAATASAGTFLADGANNSTATLTLTNKFATKVLSVNARKALEMNGENRVKLGQAQANSIREAAQAQIIASLKAQSITQTSALATGYIDFAIPAAATQPDVIKNIIQPVSRKIGRLLAENQGATVDDFYGIMSTDALDNFIAAVDGTAYKSLLTQEGTNFRYRGVELFGVNGTNFGGASLEAAFFGHKEGFAFKFNELGLWKGGPWEGDDGVIRLSSYGVYAYGTANELKLGELTNPAT